MNIFSWFRRRKLPRPVSPWPDVDVCRNPGSSTVTFLEKASNCELYRIERKRDESVEDFAERICASATQ